MKTKILILCDHYLPSIRAGGPVRSISAIVQLLKQEFDITIITRNHDIGVAVPFAESELKHDGYRVLYFSDANLMRGIQQALSSMHFDIIYFNSFVAPRMTIFTLCYLFFKRDKKYRLIISPRGELGDGALLIKNKRKKVYISIFKKLFLKKVEFLAASETEKKEIENQLGASANVYVLSNLTTHVTANQNLNAKEPEKIKIIFLSRISKKKNLLGAVDILSRVKGQVAFDIVGPIEEKDYWQNCQVEMKKLPENITVNYRGECDPDRVIEILKLYDLFFLPSWNENYGHVIVESLAAGCPVLLSDQTPWHDLSSHDAGWEFPLLIPEKFSEKIDQLITLDNAAYDRFKDAAMRYYINHITDVDLEKKYFYYFARLLR